MSLSIDYLRAQHETLKANLGDQNTDIQNLGKAFKKVDDIRKELQEFKGQTQTPAVKLKTQILEKKLETQIGVCQILFDKISETLTMQTFSNPRPDMREYSVTSFSPRTGS